MILKKIILIVLLFIANFFSFYYLTEYVGINTTFSEITMNLVISLICIPIGSLLAAYYNYNIRLTMKRVYIPFKQIYQDICLKVYIGCYSVMLLVALLTLLK